MSIRYGKRRGSGRGDEKKKKVNWKIKMKLHGFKELNSSPFSEKLMGGEGPQKKYINK